ncbi:hypothetical protein [Sphingomonas quercus]|uniref:Uncharacterized protein n=1 Tax=Sphingomonas quercus TaxID=2842451 RepID=A0ABS6BI19_9SPHN|nr:hypothetical protein [Sphingomonas quercus]MBU3077953.1 hypothetical protein [Sphingomonas quercus]
MATTVDRLADVLCTAIPGGQEILVNIADGLEDGSIDAGRLRLFAEACLARLDRVDRQDEGFGAMARTAIASVVFTPPAGEDGRPIDLQYAALIEASDDHIMTFMTLGKLHDLAFGSTRLAAALKAELGPLWLGTDFRFIPDEQGEAIAEIINKEGAASGLKLSRIGANATPFPIWITRSVVGDTVLGQTSPQERATRMRDWLGLGLVDIGAPVFGFRSNRPLPHLHPAKLGRPTVWDGIDHWWFKHRRSSPRLDAWGRTLDFAAAVSGCSDCDGGPEAVMPGPAFDEGFTCFYLGTVQTSPMPPGPSVLGALIASDPPRAIEAIRQRVADALSAGG